MRPRSAPPSPSPRRVTDRRYRSRRWLRLSDAVLGKTKTQRKPTALCVEPEPGPHLAQVANHIRRVTPATTDREFFDRRNVNAMCQRHNLAKGFRETAGTDDSWGEPREPKPPRSIFTRRSR